MWITIFLLVLVSILLVTLVVPQRASLTGKPRYGILRYTKTSVRNPPSMITFYYYDDYTHKDEKGFHHYLGGFYPTDVLHKKDHNSETDIMTFEAKQGLRRGSTPTTQIGDNSILNITKPVFRRFFVEPKR